MAPDEDPREASSIYPKIPLQLSNIASWLSYNINSTLLWEIANQLEAGDIMEGNALTTHTVDYIPGEVGGSKVGTIIRPEQPLPAPQTDMTAQRAPSLDDIETAIRRCRSGILGNMRPDIDNVYCIMSEDMFRNIVNNNQTVFRNASFTGRESTLWTVNQVSEMFGIGLILRNATLRYRRVAGTESVGFVPPLPQTGEASPPSTTDRDCALFFTRGSLLQYTSRIVSFRDANTPEFLGSTYRWKLNYGAGVTTKFPIPTPNQTRGVLAVYADANFV